MSSQFSTSKIQISMKILIYGAGVIGSLYAALFAEAGYDKVKEPDLAKCAKRKDFG